MFKENKSETVETNQNRPEKRYNVTDIAKDVRLELKKEFPQCKWSVTVEKYSMGWKLSRQSVQSETTTPSTHVEALNSGENPNVPLTPFGRAIELLELILPLAKGYAAEHRVGNNDQYVLAVENWLGNEKI